MLVKDYKTKLEYGNCVFATLYLIIRGKVSSIAFVTSQIRWVAHLVCLNKKGHAIHFCPVLSDEENIYAPFWFLGQMQGVKKSDLHDELSRRNRRLIFASDKVGIILSCLLLFCGIFFIPWLVAWGMFPLF